MFGLTRTLQTGIALGLMLCALLFQTLALLHKTSHAISADAHVAHPSIIWQTTTTESSPDTNEDTTNKLACQLIEALTGIALVAHSVPAVNVKPTASSAADFFSALVSQTKWARYAPRAPPSKA